MNSFVTFYLDYYALFITVMSFRLRNCLIGVPKWISMTNYDNNSNYLLQDIDNQLSESQHQFDKTGGESTNSDLISRQALYQHLLHLIHSFCEQHDSLVEQLKHYNHHNLASNPTTLHSSQARGIISPELALFNSINPQDFFSKLIHNIIVFNSQVEHIGSGQGDHLSNTNPHNPTKTISKTTTQHSTRIESDFVVINTTRGDVEKEDKGTFRHNHHPVAPQITTTTLRSNLQSPSASIRTHNAQAVLTQPDVVIPPPQYSQGGLKNKIHQDEDEKQDKDHHQHQNQIQSGLGSIRTHNALTNLTDLDGLFDGMETRYLDSP